MKKTYFRFINKRNNSKSQKNIKHQTHLLLNKRTKIPLANNLAYCQFLFNNNNSKCKLLRFTKPFNFNKTQFSFYVPCWCLISFVKVSNSVNLSWNFPSTARILFCSLRISKQFLKNFVRNVSCSWIKKKSNLMRSLKIKGLSQFRSNKWNLTILWRSSAYWKYSVRWSRNLNSLLTDIILTTMTSSWPNSKTSLNQKHCFLCAKQ